MAKKEHSSNPYKHVYTLPQNLFTPCLSKQHIYHHHHLLTDLPAQHQGHQCHTTHWVSTSAVSLIHHREVAGLLHWTAAGETTDSCPALSCPSLPQPILYTAARIVS